jgi:hypothetical protein
MIECKKRQKVISNGKISHRCLNRECELYGQKVDTICNDCPLNRLNGAGWGGPCSRRQVLTEDTAICHGVSKEVARQECNACLVELATFNLQPDIIIRQYREHESEIEKDKDYPSLLTQVNNYRLSVTRWIKAGRPTRTEGEIERLFIICKKCDWYDVKTSRCKGCGCRVVPKGLAIVNKLKMATEHCPRNLF